jgi:hypothetical protein
MKGPGHGNQYDVRRVWECPVCQKRVKTGGQVVSLRCEACARNKTGDTACMKLLESRRPWRSAYPTVTPAAPEQGGELGVEVSGANFDANPLSSSKQNALE